MNTSPVDNPPSFFPHPFLWNGHLQTLGGLFLRSPRFVERAEKQQVELPDGDRLVLHDDLPAAWRVGDRVAILIHGLAGSHASPYMQRIAHKLNARGVRTFRMDLRGCGAGLSLARWPYHSGRSEDAAAALARITELCPGSPATLIGFSLGGNISLKLLGESPSSVPLNVDRAVAVSPPIDLAACVRQLRTGLGKFYDRFFVRLCLEQITARCAVVPDAVLPDGWQPGGQVTSDLRRVRPTGMEHFDELFTAPVCGYGTAANYYTQCSSAQFLPAIRIATLILAATDDPLLPSQSFRDARLSPSTSLALTHRGGHLGFVTRSRNVADRRWMDHRVVEFAIPEP